MTDTMPIRVLLVKLGLDGHDRGIKVVMHILRDAGMEVIYTGRRAQIEEVLRTAAQEDVDVIGLSLLNNNHLTISKRLIEAMLKSDVTDIPVVVGGIIPKEDVPPLKAMGISDVFHVHSAPEDIVNRIRALVTDRRNKRDEEELEAP